MLLTTPSGSGTDQVSSNRQLGHLPCNRIPHVSGCRFPGINYLGGDLSPQEGGYGIETSDPDHCRRECAKRQKCSFWSHIKHWKVNCYLKEKKGPDRNFDGATSGSLFIPCGRSKKSV